jgi:phenylpropionate dioxygenase-like ring-hydroxylating dioxygenase large terminal subunit
MAFSMRIDTLDPQALVQPHQVHRDIYVDAQLFALEMQRLWARAWLFVGHASQVPQPGDFITTQLGAQPVLMLRQPDGGIQVLHNRCAHKGSLLTAAPAGNTGRMLRCPYHGWSYQLDGRLLATPLREGYAGTGFERSAAAQGLTRYGEVAQHRGFVFARGGAGAAGPSFIDWAGEQLAALDLLADRSPQGELRVAGGVLRTVVHANWKIYLENINDAVHPVSTHQSATDAARSVWAEASRQHPPNPPMQATADGAGAQAEGVVNGPAATPPLAMQQLLPFGSGYDFFQHMGGRVLPHGHSVLGTQHSIHSAYAALPGYADQLRAAHGAQRAQQVMSFTPQNVVLYPSLALKGAPQVMRVLRPLAVDRTLVEAWAFEAVGAPPELLQSALTYNRIAFSPASIVAADDLHLFECIQCGLAAQGNPWVNLQREVSTPIGDQAGADLLPRDVSGIDEALLRNQYLAWVKFMGSGL